MFTFKGSNPGQIYLDALNVITEIGDSVSPRGKEVKEIRPASIEYTNPLNRVVNLEGRLMNPFFLLAEAWWIVNGRSDVDWLAMYNENMRQFSDDGEHFNAPYGQRLRYWNSNSVIGFIFNPLDQLLDVYKKLQKDRDTRQAVAVIYNPLFDNSQVETLDRPCNLILTFKIRNNKLELTVFNRSNDIHYGVFTNLVQFSTIQEMLASWLEIEVGSYHQITDSLHNYLNDFGAKETDKILSEYSSSDSVQEFFFSNEPRITSDFNQTNMLFNMFQDSGMDAVIHSDEIAEDEIFEGVMRNIDIVTDDYWKMTFYAMIAYRTHKLERPDLTFKALEQMQDGQWKMSCLRFLYKKYKGESEFTSLYDHYDTVIKRFIERKKPRHYSN